MSSKLIGLITGAAAVFAGFRLVCGQITRDGGDLIAQAACRAGLIAPETDRSRRLDPREWFPENELAQSLIDEVQSEVERIEHAIGDPQEPITRAALLVLISAHESFVIEGEGPAVAALHRVNRVLASRLRA